ncbi:alpha/beta hydrolase [Microbacterium sp. EF45047]|nr:alpha/beta hydrolase [Microbacterium neungamense]WCM56839.1 alpha/beta hydrolase [Microbacterium sp. EF45047]
MQGQRFRVFSSLHPESSVAFLLVHGIGISHRLFSRLHGVLAAEHTVHTVDLPGFGGLPRPPWSPDVPEMSRLLGQALDRLGADRLGADRLGAGGLGAGRLVAVGDSMGTQWVVELGVQRPDLVSHVVAIGPVVDDRHRTAGAQARALALDCLREPPSAYARVLTEYLRCGPRWYSSQLRHMLSYPIEERVLLLPRPLLILRGGRDPIAGPAWCARLQRRAPLARTSEIPGHPHLVQHTAPWEVAGEIVRFVQGMATGAEAARDDAAVTADEAP